MKADLTGTVMEKFSREQNKDGTKIEKLYLRLYQPGERVNVDVLVNTQKYYNIDVGEEITIENVSVSAFNNNIYCRMN